VGTIPHVSPEPDHGAHLIEVLLVAADQEEVAQVRAALSGQPFRVRAVDTISVSQGEVGAADRVDVVLVTEGVDAEGLRAGLGEEVPLVLLVEHWDEDATLQAVERGALDAVGPEDLSPRVLPRSLRYVLERRRLEAEVRRMAYVDPLTGLSNRRHLAARLDGEFAAARRHCHPLSVVMADVDHFKLVNDAYGHSVGDDVLRAIGAILKQGLRTEDVAGRWGGDEFLLLLPHISLPEAERAVERLKTALGEAAVPLPGGGRLPLSVSFGPAELAPVHDRPQDLFDAADAAVYRAKSLRTSPDERRSA
jgi:diguanylate cyclase (GGDEF)-like protein